MRRVRKTIAQREEILRKRWPVECCSSNTREKRPHFAYDCDRIAFVYAAAHGESARTCSSCAQNTSETPAAISTCGGGYDAWKTAFLGVADSLLSCEFAVIKRADASLPAGKLDAFAPRRHTIPWFTHEPAARDSRCRGETQGSKGIPASRGGRVDLPSRPRRSSQHGGSFFEASPSLCFGVVPGKR